MSAVCSKTGVAGKAGSQAHDSARPARRLRRRTYRLKVLGSLTALAVFGLLSIPQVQRDLLGLAAAISDTFGTYRLVSERNTLIATNQSLQQEVAQLRAKLVAASGSDFEASVRSQLEELQSAIEAATEMEVRERDHTVARARNSRNPRKQNISLEIGPSFARLEDQDDGGRLAPTQSDMQRKLKILKDHVRALPIGYPAEGEVTSHFGYRNAPFSKRLAFHEGMDISLHRGADVIATGDGVVTEAKFDGAYGWVVDVTHSQNVVSRYAHLSKTLVRVGDSVKRGQRIALSGNTGRSTGPHLHYEVRVDGEARDPLVFAQLPQRLARLF